MNSGTGTTPEMYRLRPARVCFLQTVALLLLGLAPIPAGWARARGAMDSMRSGELNFADREAKAKYMSKAARHDAEDPILLGWARQFNRLPVDKRAAAILRFVQRCIRYERDPAWFDRQGTRHGIELLDSAAVRINRGYGDCDLKARLFVALCIASGVVADIEPVFTGDTGFPHVRARVLRETTETAGERWETADPTRVNSTIGHLPRKALTAFPHEAT